MLDDAQRAEVEELVALLVPKLVAAEVAKQLAEQVAVPGVTPSPPPQTDRVPHTVWEGKADKDFVYDPPYPQRRNLLIARGATKYSSFHVVQYVRSEIATRAIADKEIGSYDGSLDVLVVEPGVTHLGIHSTGGSGWRVEVADLDKLPELALPAAGEASAVFTHRLGMTRAVIRSADSVTVAFYEHCDCGSVCDKVFRHSSRKTLAWTYRKGKTEFELPAAQGIVHIAASKPWSLEAKRGR